MTLDLQLCSAVIRDKDLETVFKAHFPADALFDEGRKCFDFIVDHYRSYVKIPDKATVETECGVTLEDVPEPLPFYLDKVKKREISSIIQEGIGKSLEKLEARDVDEAMTALKATIGNVQQKAEVSGERVLEYTKSTDLRKQWYEEIEKLAGGIDGIPTPFPKLDEITLGWHKGELITVVARLGVGKTFLATLFAQRAFIAGFTPLMVSMEMSTKQLLRRADSLYFKKSPKLIRSATLDAFGKKAYYDGLDELAAKQEHWWFAGSGFVNNVVDIEMLITEKQPKIVIIDSFYLLQGRKRHQSNWERVAEVIQDIKKLAQRKDIPIIVTTQFGRRAAKKDGGGDAEEVAFADNIMQDSDIGIALVPETDPKYEGMMRLNMLKLRDGNPRDIRINWDLDKVDFKEIGFADETTYPTEEEETTPVASY